MHLGSTLRDKARALKRETVALYFAVRDPRTPLAAKIVAGLVAAYALSPIDLIPDFIPVLGYLDDVILVPLGIALAIRMIPENVLADARAKAASALAKPKSYFAAVVVIILWLSAAVLFSLWLVHAFDKA
ncbi:YkvA family protein [Noviherbaspirillum massiliense]|uniref:YkvA family protein n=1 Tax=Noviherbaspirillum massiliense TaxID=1465823 RepID=UPI000313C5A8|nr:YkvA family protein [Noviherbaspirillum massiliense]